MAKEQNKKKRVNIRYNFSLNNNNKEKQRNKEITTKNQFLWTKFVVFIFCIVRRHSTLKNILFQSWVIFEIVFVLLKK